MTLREIVWSDEAERELLAMAPSEAERIVDAAEEYALTGRGFLRVLQDGSNERRLYVDSHYLHLEMSDSDFRVVRVVRRQAR